MNRSLKWALFASILLSGITVGRAQTPQTAVLSPPAIAPSDVLGALDSLAMSGRALVVGTYLGDARAMENAAQIRERALDQLEQAVITPEVILELPWPARREWLGVALSERLHHWNRFLLEGLEGRLPEPGSPGRGPMALAVALNALRLLESDPEDENAFLRGAEQAALDRVAQTALEAAAAERFLLRDEAIYRLWQLAETNGETAQAEAWADSLVTWSPRSPRTPHVRITRARARLDAGEAAAAVEEARLGHPSADTAEISWFIAKALVVLDFRREAARELERLIGTFGDERLALRALEWRENMGDEDSSLYLTVGERLKLRESLLKQPGSGAVAWMRTVADSTALSATLREDAALRLSRYFYTAKRYAEAEPLLQRLTQSKSTRAQDEAHLILARIYRNTGRIPEMEPHYRHLAAKPRSEASRALWELGREYQSLGGWAKADSTFGELIDRFPKDRHRHDSLFRRGFVRVRLGQPEPAVEDFRAALAASRTPEDEEQAAFWLARTLRLLGRENEAREAARAGASRPEPSDYYGVLLRERFQLRADAPAPPASCPLDPESPLSLLAQSDQWPQPVRDHFLRGLMLAELGQPDAARAEWTRAASLGKRIGPVFQGLSFAAATHHVYPEGITWASRAAALLPGRHEARSGFNRLRFPPAYYGELQTAADREKVSAQGLWALMRQESLYDPLAVSHAGARGLMQIMPATLVRITSEAGMPGLSTDALFQPKVNIALGTRFFADRYAEFGNRLLPTLASYNAGERKAWQWLESAGGEAEEMFVESIGYPETYGYVRRIPWLIWVYESYYTDQTKAPHGQEGR